MIQVFITVVFVAELIIASWLVFNIYKLDNKVLMFSESVENCQVHIKNDFRYLKFILRIINNRTRKFKKLLKQKQYEYTLRILKTILIYTSFFMLKGKYKKMLLGYEFGKEIVEAIQEA